MRCLPNGLVPNNLVPGLWGKGVLSQRAVQSQSPIVRADSPAVCPYR